MKKILLFLLFYASLATYAQVNVGPKIDVTRSFPDQFHPEALKALKETKTYFIYGKQDEKQLEEWEKVLEKVWTITSFDFMSVQKFNRLKDKDYEGKSFLIKYQKTHSEYLSSSYGLVYDAWSCLSLITVRPGGEYYFYCRIDLAPDLPTSRYAEEFYKLKQSEKIKYLYKKAKFYNWQPGLVMAPLSFVNDALDKEEQFNLFQKVKPTTELGELKTKTLYVPEYVFLLWLGAYEETKFVDIERMKSKYGFKIEVKSAEKLSQLILEKPNDVYVLFYLNVIDTKFISVWNTNTGELLYKKHKAHSYILKSKDFKKLAKAIRKAAS
jgi:hypothetical protein